MKELGIWHGHLNITSYQNYHTLRAATIGANMYLSLEVRVPPSYTLLGKTVPPSYKHDF